MKIISFINISTEFASNLAKLKLLIKTTVNASGSGKSYLNLIVVLNSLFLRKGMAYKRLVSYSCNS